MDLPTSTAMKPTISLALIAKNEEKNIRRLLNSVKDCFNEIVLVDTGSTDKTKEIALEYGCKVYDFVWVNSFCKARNFAFSKATQDFVMWLDLDDVLDNREGFIQWRDNAMQFVDCWFNTYNYALDKAGKPIVSFVRERVFRRSVNPTWKYDLHEGIIGEASWSKNYAVTWNVNHMRDSEDIAQDKSRNLKILEGMKDIDTRMQFYYGKELYEAGRHFEAIDILAESAEKPDIEPHDKLLAYQYGAYAAMAAGNSLKDDQKEAKHKFFDKAIELALKGIKIEPNRAEFYIGIGDSLIQQGRLVQAIPYFAAAKACFNPQMGGSKYEGAIYSFLNCYGELPCLQLAKIYFNIGQIEKAKTEAKECWDKYKNEEAQKMIEELDKVTTLINLDNNQEMVDDIVFSCPPQSAYEFDEDLYKVKGMGGSETALIEMARHLKKKTGRKVKVFNMRAQDMIADSGVEYISNRKLNEYMSKFRPAVHIAWRHNIRVTHSKSYLWCHDLSTPSVESIHNFDKMLCLSPFHKEYTKGLQGVPDEKIVLTRNGINPDKFKFEHKVKNPNKLVWMSSPDRGLDRAMFVVDEVRKEFPDVELHVYYGLDNLYKFGMGAQADSLKKMMDDRSYVKYHGFTEQNQMYRDVSDAVAWIHPCNFIETFCITGLEMLALGVFPITRRLGALANTLAQAESQRQAILLDHDCVTPEEIKAYADAVCKVLLNRQWENVCLDIHKHSWGSVADEWINQMELK